MSVRLSVRDPHQQASSVGLQGPEPLQALQAGLSTGRLSQGEDCLCVCLWNVTSLLTVWRHLAVKNREQGIAAHESNVVSWERKPCFDHMQILNACCSPVSPAHPRAVSLFDRKRADPGAVVSLNNWLSDRLFWLAGCLGILDGRSCLMKCLQEERKRTLWKVPVSAKK